MKNKGFTLIELLAVIVILAIVLAIAVPSISSIIKSSAKAAFESDAKLVLKAIDYEKLDDSGLDITSLTEANIKSNLGLSNDNYSSLSIVLEEDIPIISIVGKNKWAGLIACGSFDTMKIVTSLSDCSTDVIQPVITLNGNDTVSINQDEIYTDLGATAIDNKDGDVTSKIVVTSNINPSIPGPYIVTYSVTDMSGNKGTATRTVNVIDNVYPTISFGTNGNSTYAKTRSTTVTVSDVGGLDVLKYLWNTSTTTPIESSFTNVFANGGSITSPSSVTGSYYLWILAKDKTGNTKISRSNVFNLDNTIPVITITGANPITINKGSTYTDQGATATDNVDSSVNVIAIGSVNPNVVGTYTITYNATDSSGNIAVSETRAINVVDAQAPVITIIGTNPITMELGSTYTDAGATALDDVDGNVTSKITTTSNVNPNVVGTYNVTYTVKDNANNTSTATRIVNVVDTIKPTVPTFFGMTYADGVTNYVNDTWTKQAVYMYGGISGSTDANGILKYQISADNINWVDYVYNSSQPMYALTTTGIYYRYARAVDKAGNTSNSITKTIKIDVTPPVLTISGSNPITVIKGNTYTDAGATATDAHSGINGTVSSTNNVNTSVAGSYYVSYNVSDKAGNSSGLTRTVKVVAPYTATNLILNGGYEAGQSEWGLSNADIISGTAYSGSYSLRLWPGTTSMSNSLQRFPPIYGHKYYGSVMSLTAPSFTVADARYEWYYGDIAGALMTYAQKNQSFTTWTKLSAITTLENNTYSSYNWVIRNFTVNASAYSYADNLILVDLTATFGAGNEPDLAWCDNNISFFTGTTTIYK